MNGRRRFLGLMTAAVIGASLSVLPGHGSGPPDRLRFLATADTGSGDSHQLAVGLRMAEAHRREPVDLVVMAGDNIYPSGDMALAERTFRRPYAALLAAGVPFHAVLGNHDIRTANGAHQMGSALFGMAGRWYSLRRGPVQFFFLDTNVNAPWQQQLPWLKTALQASNAPWKVVVGHHPLFSAGFYGNDAVAIARLTPLFRRFGVQLYINGHDHNYERTSSINGTTYLTVGNGGAHLRPVVPNRNTAVAVSTYGFAEVSVDRDRMRIDAWDSKGKRIDQATLHLGT
jgi:3',5'-cyclic AMP phosphodiesterase CpdA